MKAFVLEDRNKASIKNMIKPELVSDFGAILSPIAISICTSDINTVYGSGSKKPKDLILGHECVAKITEVGKKVRDFKVGDIVAVPSMTPDWNDYHIQDNNFLHAGKNFSANALGRSLPGVFAEYFYLDNIDLNVALLPAGVSIESALMCTDMVTTGFSGIEEADIEFGDTVVVLGIGAVGLMAVQGAALKGASNIIGVGSRQVCKELAVKYGATNIIDYKNNDILEAFLEINDNKPADAVIICGGNDEVFELAIKLTKYGSGRIVNLKHYAGDGNIGMPKFFVGRGMSGHRISLALGKGGRMRMERLLSLVKTGKITPENLITHKYYGFDNINRCFEMMRNKSEDLIKIELIPEWN